jgi:peptide/nickel transport system substrate-binding protein
LVCTVRRVIALLAAGSVVALSACGGSSHPKAAAGATAKPTAGGTLTYYGATENPGMDWTAGSPSTSVATGVYDQLIYDSLIRVDVNGKIQPRLAESVTGTPDLLTWTIKLKPNLKFSDGTPFDASSIMFNWKRDADPATGGRCVGDASELASYSMVDDLTIRASLKAANSQFPGLLMDCLGQIGSPTAFQKEGAAAFNNAPVGAGPYVLKEWVRNDHATFVKNPLYWDAPRPYIDTVIYRPVTDIQQRVNAFVAAGSSAVWSAASVVSQYPDQLKAEGYQVEATQTWGGVAVGLNIAAVPAFQDVNVRRAFELALNLQDLNVKAAEGHATMATSVFPTNSPFYAASGTFQENDLPAAQKLIDTYVSSHGPISVNFDVATGIQAWGDAVTQQLSRLKGVTIHEQLQDGATTEAELTSKNYQMIWTGGSGVDPEPNMWNNFHTGGLNNSGYVNPQMDTALQSGRSSISLSVRRAAYVDVAQLWAQDVPMIPIYRPISPHVVSKNVRGFQVYGPGFFDFAVAWLAS